MTLNYKIFGDGKPLVILHGLLGSLDNWVTVSKYLAKKYKVYIIDLPNHGKSYHTKYFSYENMANDLDSFFVEHGLTKFSLLGHSMGGKLALKYVDMFEDKIDKLILVDIANKNYEYTRFNHVFDAIFSISLNNLETRKDADSIVSAAEVPVPFEGSGASSHVAKVTSAFSSSSLKLPPGLAYLSSWIWLSRSGAGQLLYI